jgi:hypothetical protein
MHRQWSRHAQAVATAHAQAVATTHAQAVVTSYAYHALGPTHKLPGKRTWTLITHCTQYCVSVLSICIIYIHTKRWNLPTCCKTQMAAIMSSTPLAMQLVSGTPWF